MPRAEVTPESLASVLGAILATSHSDSDRVLEVLAATPAIQEAREAIAAGHAVRLRQVLVDPTDDVVRALLREAKLDWEASFLLRESRFVERHLSSLFTQFEGSACSSDKMRTVFAAALRFFRTGRPIEFDRAQEYTFHLPKQILATHEDIVAFVRALAGLHAGQSRAYIECLARMAAQVTSAATPPLC